MQAGTQDLSVMLGAPLPGPVSGTAAPGQAQPAGFEGETPGTDFLAALDSSLQALTQGQQSPLVPFDPAQLQATFEQYLDGQLPMAGGNGLPLGEGVGAAATDVLNPDLRGDLQVLLTRLRTVLATAPASAELSATALPPQPATPSMSGAVITPLTAADAAQTLLEQRRLFERFEALPEVRQVAGELPVSALRQALGRLGEQPPLQQSAPVTEMPPGTNWLGERSVDLAVTPAVQGVDFALQLSKMVELKNISLSLRDGAVFDSMAKSDMADMTPLASAVPQRQMGPASLSADTRPVSSFIQTPLHDPQWQSDFSNRVTWLARAGGNQTAEIRLNPANMGPIEVRVVMNDDQATITFTAQHGVVRDAIEASLPRLREMFSGSGLQLAQANVSDQPLHEQRQRQQQGFGSGNGSGNGRSQGGYDQVNGIAEFSSPISLSMPHSAALAGRLDLYA